MLQLKILRFFFLSLTYSSFTRYSVLLHSVLYAILVILITHLSPFVGLLKTVPPLFIFDNVHLTVLLIPIHIYIYSFGNSYRSFVLFLYFIAYLTHAAIPSHSLSQYLSLFSASHKQRTLQTILYPTADQFVLYIHTHN